MTRPTGRQIVMGAAIVAVVGAVVAGVAVLDSPGVMRDRENDSRRAGDLSAITRGVDIYWERNGRLPDSLTALHQTSSAPPEMMDPVTQQPYEYRATGADRYELCATFDRESAARVDDFWAHGAGRHCFALEAGSDEKRSR